MHPEPNAVYRKHKKNLTSGRGEPKKNEGLEKCDSKKWEKKGGNVKNTNKNLP